MLIRHKNSEDQLEEIAYIYEQSWKRAYQGIISQDYLDCLSKDQWIANLKNPNRKILLMFDHDQLIGTCSYSIARMKKMKDYGEIISIYFLPEYMGKGYGVYLLKRALYELKKSGYKNVYLWVLEENVRARRFYQRVGFQPSSTVTKAMIGNKEYNEIMYIIHMN